MITPRFILSTAINIVMLIFFISSLNSPEGPSYWILAYLALSIFLKTRRYQKEKAQINNMGQMLEAELERRQQEKTSVE